MTQIVSGNVHVWVVGTRVVVRARLQYDARTERRTERVYLVQTVAPADMYDPKIITIQMFFHL